MSVTFQRPAEPCRVTATGPPSVGTVMTVVVAVTRSILASPVTALAGTCAGSVEDRAPASDGARKGRMPCSQVPWSRPGRAQARTKLVATRVAAGSEAAAASGGAVDGVVAEAVTSGVVGACGGSV